MKLAEIWAEAVIAIGTLGIIFYKFTNTEKRSEERIKELTKKVNQFEQVSYEYKVRLAILEEKHPELKSELAELREKFEKIREAFLKYFTDK